MELQWKVHLICVIQIYLEYLQNSKIIQSLMNYNYYYFLKYIVFYRAETVRCALDVLAIACVMPKVQILLCEKVDLPEESITVGKWFNNCFQKHVYI